MATFFDKFRKYAKDYSRERYTKTKDAYWYWVESLVSTTAIKGILTKKSTRNETLSEGKSSVPYWMSTDIMYMGPEIDVIGGDIIIDGNTQYEVEHMEFQDDFKVKNSHKIAYLKKNI